jgi:hypothetical protein
MCLALPSRGPGPVSCCRALPHTAFGPCNALRRTALHSASLPCPVCYCTACHCIALQPLNATNATERHCTPLHGTALLLHLPHLLPVEVGLQVGVGWALSCICSLQGPSHARHTKPCSSMSVHWQCSRCSLYMTAIGHIHLTKSIACCVACRCRTLILQCVNGQCVGPAAACGTRTACI